MTVHPMSAGLMSLFFPGVGQLMAGRVGSAFYFAALAIFMWVISMGFFGWIIHICAALNAWHICSEPELQRIPQETKPEKDILWN
jgi:TM2 domain-containing membrane protein YozV|tara:strand:+ start:2220 stop:2474 length:255 start_codon:yes stop_codon:yes gene_type:complete